jgi:hypothetical protein
MAPSGRMKTGRISNPACGNAACNWGNAFWTREP